jgi:hypothetical protein
VNRSPRASSRSKAGRNRDRNGSLEKEECASEKKKGKETESPRSAKRRLEKAISSSKAGEKNIVSSNSCDINGILGGKNEKKVEGDSMQSPKSSSNGMNFVNFISSFKRKESRSPPHGEKSPTPNAVEGVVDKGVQEALQRHNLGSVVSTLLLGSTVEQTSSLPSPTGKTKKIPKKKIRSAEKQRSRDAVSIEAELAELVSRSQGTAGDLTEAKEELAPLRLPVFEESNLASLATTSGKGDHIESLRSQVKKMKKHTKQKIFDIKMHTEEGILDLEHSSAQKKATLVEKLKSIGADADPTVGVKYLRTKKVGKLHEEGKSLRNEIKQLEHGISEESTLTANLITESLEIQHNTREVLGRIARAERQHEIYTNSVRALQSTHTSLSSLLEEGRDNV